MQVDKQWIREHFALFNKRYFNGVLPEPHFFVGHSRTRLGFLSFKRRLGRSGEYKLGISNYFDQTEHQFCSVLLHEMIHLRISSGGLKDTSPHGVIFQTIMAKLNSYGWDIHVSTSMSGIPPADKEHAVEETAYLVLALEMTDGRRFLSSVSPRSAVRLNRQLKGVSEVRKHAWYVSTDHWFEKMPRVRSLRGVRVTAEFYEKLIAAMEPLSVPS